MCYGRISVRSILPRPLPSTRGASGALVPDLVEQRAGRWTDLSTRVASALVLAPTALASVWAGGIAFTLIVVAIALGLAVEWLLLCRRPGGSLLRPAGFVYVAVAGSALLWLRA